jgi:long-subunit fatty acid transport protein
MKKIFLVLGLIITAAAAYSQQIEKNGFFEFTENFQSSSVGINAKLGLIYKPQESIRLGFALHTPSLMFFNDEISASLTTNTEGYAGEVSESSNNLNGGVPGSRKYLLLTPLKLIGSASYVFSEVEDTRLQKGFVTADIEYVNYQGARFYSNDKTSYDATTGYYDALNSVTKDYLKGDVNFKLGGELKFDPWAVRIGGGYYGSPYEDKALKASKTMLSAGLGYRNHGMYIDAAYVYSINKDVNFPYRLNDKPNTFAEWKNNKSNVVLTVGFKI